MASNDQKPRLFKFPIGPLALPGCKSRRIAAEISNELDVMTELAKRMLQFVGVRAPNLPAIVPMPLNYLDHLVDIGPNEGRHRDWSTIQPALRVAGLHVPQGRARLNGSPALRLRFGLVLPTESLPSTRSTSIVAVGNGIECSVGIALEVTATAATTGERLYQVRRRAAASRSNDVKDKSRLQWLAALASGRSQLQAIFGLPVKRYFLPARASRSSGVSAALACAPRMSPTALAYRRLEAASTRPAARNPAPPA